MSDQTPPQPASAKGKFRYPWATLAALIFALLAQYQFETPRTDPALSLKVGFGLFEFAIAFALWAWLDGELTLSPLPATRRFADSLDVRWGLLGVSLLFLLASFLLFGGNKFTLLNVSVWLVGLALLLFSLRDPAGGAKLDRAGLRQGWLSRLQNGIKLSPWTISLIAIFIVIIFFRFYRLADVPHDGYSDHAEKLMDVAEVLLGQTRIFFPRNTGREAIQMYLTALVALVCGTGASFLSLKIGTALAGAVAMPFVYGLAKELGGRRVAALAMLLAGMSYWHNVTSRVALRYTLYPLFAAAVLYFLVRGLRRARRSDMIWAGALLGLGLHGYTAFRIMPVVVLAVMALFWLHRQSRGVRVQTIFWLVLMVLVSLMVSLPLARYTLENPDMVLYRSVTRLTGAEQAISKPVLEIFFFNLGRALAMPNWYNGDIWAHSVMGRPALDVVGGALWILGAALVTMRYFRERNWLDITLLALVPLLMLPSIMSIAFPLENPSLNRTGAAIIPVFILAALALDAVMGSLERAIRGKFGLFVAGMMAFVLVAFSAYQNYDLVFVQYARQYRQLNWNSAEMGAVVRDFIENGGSIEQTYIVSFPYWVDSRLVAIEAGFPLDDPIAYPGDLMGTLSISPPKLFLLAPDDGKDLENLKFLYPQGIVSRYTSATFGKDFIIFEVMVR